MTQTDQETMKWYALQTAIACQLDRCKIISTRMEKAVLYMYRKHALEWYINYLEHLKTAITERYNSSYVASEASYTAACDRVSKLREAAATIQNKELAVLVLPTLESIYS
jgi:hypothetical protein